MDAIELGCQVIRIGFMTPQYFRIIDQGIVIGSTTLQWVPYLNWRFEVIVEIVRR
jgi:hypothetical protein